MSIPVLMYHHILPKPGYITVSVDVFRQQMEWLKNNNFQTLSADSFANILSGNIPKPKKCVLLTFDDGWRDNLIYAYPILKILGFKAILFTATQWVEAASQESYPYRPLDHKNCVIALENKPHTVFCNWNELKTMEDVFTYAPHTHTHDIPSLEDLDFWKQDLLTNRTLLKKYLPTSSRLDFLCWPKGEYTKDLLDLAQSLEFTHLFTCNRGPNRIKKPTLAIKRLVAKNSLDWIKRACKYYSMTPIAYLLSIFKPR